MAFSKSLLLLSVLTLLLTHTFADFDNDDLNDHYTLQAGETSTCAQDFEVEEENLTLEADDIELDDRGCDGGFISLVPYPGPPTTPTTAIRNFVAKEKEIGDFLAGFVVSRIECGPKAINNNVSVIFIKPEKDIKLTWEQIYGPGSTLSGTSSLEEVDLDDGTKYLFLGDACYYRERSITDSVCFPADATVTLPDGSARRMDAVQTGDRVLVADGTYSRVFGWTHRTSEKSSSRYVEIVAASGHRLVSTPGHYVYADGKPMLARLVKVGMKLRAVGAGEVDVVKVSRVRGKGLYNPQTLHGDIVVNGLVATTYTQTVEPTIAHSLLAPLRMAWHVAARWVISDGKSEL